MSYYIPQQYYQHPPPQQTNLVDDPVRLDDDFNVFEYDDYIPTQEPNTKEDDEDDDEPVPNQGRGKGKFANRARAKPWEEREVVALAKAWIRVSEDGVVGDQQKANSFWLRVLSNFKGQLGGTARTHHQINSKWNTINTKIKKFNGIYIQMKRRWESGCSDKDIMQKTQKEYRFICDKKKSFNLIDAWKVVQDYPKWKPAPLMGEEFED